jgi:hypothetical protein
MQLVPQVIRNVHDVIESDGWEVEEYLDLVVGTDAMPAEDWRRAKVFAWMADFAYFDRVLQIPLLILHAQLGVPLHELIERLIEADPDEQPVLAGLLGALRDKALSIQQGGPEYFPIPEAGGLLWPGDQRTLISLVLEGEVEAFYTEVGELLGAMLDEHGCSGSRTLLDEALTLNRAAFTFPFESEGQLMLFSHNVWEHYQSLLVGHPVELREEMVVHYVNRQRRSWPTIEAWAAHLAWAHGKDKRGYLRPVILPRAATPRIAEVVPTT